MVQPCAPFGYIASGEGEAKSTAFGESAGTAFGSGIKSAGGLVKPRVSIEGPSISQPSVETPSLNRPDIETPETPSLQRPEVDATSTGTKPQVEPEIPASKPEVESSVSPSKPDVDTAPGTKPEVEGTSTSPTGRKGHAEYPEIEKGVVAKETVTGPDGTHQIKVLKSGKVVRCSECVELRAKYEQELADPKNAHLKERLDKLEGIDDPKVKAEEAAALDAELSTQKTGLNAEDGGGDGTGKQTEKSQTAGDGGIGQRQETTNRLNDATEVPAPGAPGSKEHKAARWAEYQAQGGPWKYERWSNVYEANMVKVRVSNEAVDAFHKTLGWGQREVTVEIEGVKRRLDTADKGTLRGIEHKTSYQSADESNRWEVLRDQALVERGWDVTWVFEGSASKPLLDALRSAGISYYFR